MAQKGKANKKEQQKAQNSSLPKQQSQKVEKAEPVKTWYSKLTEGYIPYLLTFVFAVLLYANTFNHSFALDDDIVICKNEYVLQGMAGMPDIFSKDLFDSFYKQMNTTAQLAGGRYRPLSVATFALEQEFIGTRNSPVYEANCWDENDNGQQDVSEDRNKDGVYNDKDCRQKGFGLRHIDNTILYGIACCILFLFLSSVVFSNKKLLALIITLLFTAHPIHTEVVANVKSRDEIMCFLFMMLSLWLSHQFARTKHMKYALFGTLAFFAGVLSKEYAATLLFIIPLSLYLFEEQFVLKKYIPLFGGIALTFLMYYAIRSGIGGEGASSLQDKELLNNPFLLASEGEKWGTKLFIFLQYLWLQLFPYKLVSDYGYNSIPYKPMSDWRVWLSILLLIGSILGGWVALRRKSWMAFALAFYMANILLVTNLIFNVGATMGERLAFHSSLGFCMILGWILYEVAGRFGNKEYAFYLLMPIVFLYSIKTIARNKAWESDITLALTDVVLQPNSVSLNGNAASRTIDLSEWVVNKPKEKEFVQQSVQYGLKALKLHPGFVNGYLNLGLAYAKLEEYDKAKEAWNQAFKLYPSHPSKQLYYNLLADAYYRKGFSYGGTKEWATGADYIEKAVEINPNNARWWYDLGGFSYNAGRVARSQEAWKKALQLDPNDKEIRSVNGLK